MAPHKEYERRLEVRRAALGVRERRRRTFGYLRVFVFLAGLAMALAAFGPRTISRWWLFAPVPVFWWLGGRLQAAATEHATLSRAVAFYERALARLDGRWAGTGETGSRFLDRPSLYAEDLDIFGPASLFERISNARTPMGEETLAEWLLTPSNPEAVRARQEAVAELAPRLDLREDLAMLAENARSGVHAAALARWGERQAILGPSRFRKVAWVLSVIGATAAVSLIAYLLVQIGLFTLPEKTVAWLRLHFLSFLIAYSFILWRFHARTSRVIREVQEAASDLGLFAAVLRRLEAERFRSPRLAALRAELDTEGWPPSRRIARLNRLMDMLDSRRHLLIQIIGPLLLWDLHLSYALEDWRRTSGPAIRRWLNAVGEIEALSSLAGYAYDHPADVFPEFVTGSPQFEADSLGHPLLAEDRVVRNDVHIGGARVLMVSGSNMSGKSTLLRTVGINAVLAQAGAPVRARRLRLSPLEVGASIRIQDSLQGSTSRFYAEITRLHRILDAAGSTPVLFLIDEFLHGTNSHDRRIGAEAIVRGLVDRGAIGLVTTHDLALTAIADALGARAANVHFQDDLEDGRMRFDYRLRPGVVEKSNAIELMRSVGLRV